MQIDENKLQQAAYDLKFLLDRGYRKKGALTFVANKYVLNKQERNYLVRSVFSSLKSKSRKGKIIDISKIKDQFLLVDGYNVLITTESICRGDYNSIILCDDMILRDLNAVFGKYKFRKITEKALKTILDLISSYKPSYVYFFFDSPVSFSGKLSNLTNKLMIKYNLQGSANISKNVDFEVISLSKEKKGIVATSDSVIIDKVDKVVDIPYYILKMQKNG